MMERNLFEIEEIYNHYHYDKIKTKENIINQDKKNNDKKIEEEDEKIRLYKLSLLL